MTKAPAVLIVAVTAWIAAAAPAVAQDVVTLDVERLQDAVFEAGTDLARLRTGDAALLGELRAELNTIRAGLSSLVATLRDGGRVPHADYADVRERIEAVRRRARGDETATARNVPPAMTPLDDGGAARGGVDLPAGTDVEVRLLSLVDLSAARVGDRIEAVTPADVVVDEQVVVPAGSLLRGIITGAGGPLSLAFDYLTVNYRAHAIRATLVGRGALPTGTRLWQPGTVLHIRFESSALIVPPRL